MKEKMKPCPFCGSNEISVNGGAQVWWAVCEKCGCQVNASRSRKSAVKRWNTRAYENEEVPHEPNRDS